MIRMIPTANTEGARARKQTRVPGLPVMVAAMMFAAMTLAGGGGAEAESLDGASKDRTGDAQVAERTQAGREIAAKDGAGNGGFIVDIPSGETDGPLYYVPPPVSWSDPEEEGPQIRLYTIRSW